MKRVKSTNRQRAIVVLSGPAEVESLYVERINNNLYKVMSIPFFAYNISFGDIAKCLPDEDGVGLFINEIVSKSGNKTLRVRFGGLMEIKHPKAFELRKYFDSNGLLYEIFDPRLFSVNIPSDFDMKEIEDILSDIVFTVEGANWEVGDPDPEVDISGEEISTLNR